MAKLTVVVDNQAMRGLKAAWGLSILIEEQERILFDTGPDLRVLEYNMNKLNIEGKIEHLVISHGHWDHIGGITHALNYAPKVCLPEKLDFEGKVCKQPTKITEHAITTGVLGTLIKEQGLIVRGSKKTALIVGCSHPGVDNLAKTAYKLEGKLDIIIGGFHLGNASTHHLKKIAEVFKKLQVEEIYGIHCTGANAQEYFKEYLGSAYRAGYAGLSFEF